MDLAITLLSLVTGIVAGALFGLLGVPIPAPPRLAGVLGIVGIFAGYRVVEITNLGI